MSACIYSLFVLLCIWTVAVSVEITLFNTTVEFSGDNSCFADIIDRGCECDQYCIKHQECCLDYEIWLASSVGPNTNTIVDEGVIRSWNKFMNAVTSKNEINLDSFKPTFMEIERLIMDRKERLVEFACNTNVVDFNDCDNSSCSVFKILTIQKCDEMFNGATDCGSGEYDLVYDKRTELVFHNRGCAICNFVKPEHIVPFVKMIDLGDRILSDDDLKRKTAKAMKIINKSTRTEILPKNLTTYSRCQPKTYSCENEANDLLTEACLAYRGVVGCYANPHCEKCGKRYFDEICNVHDFGSRAVKPTMAIFIDTSGGLTRVYPNSDDNIQPDFDDDGGGGGDDDDNKNDDSGGGFNTEVMLSISLLNFSSEENFTKEDATTESPSTNDQNNQSVTTIYNYILFVITLSGTVISIFSILIAFLTFYIFPVMRNTSGWINILLLVTILSSCVLYLFLLVDKKIPPACRAVAIAKHFTLIATFCWTNCLGLNIYISTKPEPFSKKVQRKLFKYYFLYSWFIPTLIVGSSVAFEYSSVEETTIYEYSDCFLTGTAKLFAFIVPISVMMLLNTTLFVAILINIKRKSSVTQEQSTTSKKKRQRFEIILSVKIFFAFALYWMFGIMATVIVASRGETTTFSLVLNTIFVFTASFQAVFVCVAIVFNKRVIKMWQKKLFGRKQDKKVEKK